MFKSTAAKRFHKRHLSLRRRNQWFHLVDIKLFCLGLVFLLLTLEIVVLLSTLFASSETQVSADFSESNQRLRQQTAFEAQNDTAQIVPSSQSGPDLEELMKRLDSSLRPYQMEYLRTQALKAGERPPQCERMWKNPMKGYFLRGCLSDDCFTYQDFELAKQKCEADDKCGGIVSSENGHQLRKSSNPEVSTEPETAYPFKLSCAKRATPLGVWEAFSSTLKSAIEDESLRLDTSYGPAREDDSIYLSIATYRDESCPFTLKQAFERAEKPEKLFVGIVQQNCNHDCMTGTGWGNTRRWVEGNPDIDCAMEFCSHPNTKAYCDNSQIRIFRLEETQAYGPFFSRFLNSKLWRGETFYVQIDAHTEFRQNWDTSLVRQMKSTPSYPFSVISNYPPSGSPKMERYWGANTALFEGLPSALCGCRFENAGGKHKTVRLIQTSRRLSRSGHSDASIPQKSAFVAAGFFIAHGSIVDNVPFDPFMPYLFMGEEIALSVRFWTSGYDIYAPSVNVFRHEYVRKEGPKFWESVAMIFSNPGIHNALTDLIIPRVQILLGFDVGAAGRDAVVPQSVVTMSENYSVGSKRSVSDFVSTTGIHLNRLQQVSPAWCTHPGSV
mmetsp:Transcript_13792/g.17993  ORF Transcript_13792/g.17993 Transcript_13792/m.17993 type:complete len:611 (-) Transcript_13792:1379-3211(-)